MQRDMYDPSEIFLQYQKEIAENPIYAGMPDLYCDDGTIQWEAPSNRLSGKFKDTHDKRLKWWKEKAEAVGIDTSANQWISKTAKFIHPTKLRPCKKCGKIMDIRYIYLSQNLINRIFKLKYIPNDLPIDEVTSIYELCTLLFNLNQDFFHDVPNLLSCKQVPEIPVYTNLTDLLKWIENSYVPLEPSTLGPGAMSNAPDRFDGFHSFNRCCRKTADKGRSKSNLASYATDRRAFEFWSDGNWITANHLMGMIASNESLRNIPCFQSSYGGVHSLPCSADHIGPISLGFIHRPTFQLLCKSCNSAKNNRMYLSDVQLLLQAENAGECVASWYAKPIWDLLKNKVKTTEDALKISRVMRDNRFNALILLGDFLAKKEFIFLTSLLNLQYADFEYINPKIVMNSTHVVSATFEPKVAENRFVLIQKARKLRVAYSSLMEYLSKEQRNGLLVDLTSNRTLFEKVCLSLTPLNKRYREITKLLDLAVSSTETPDSVYEKIAATFPNIMADPIVVEVKKILIQMMSNIALTLAAEWNSDRYKRD